MRFSKKQIAHLSMTIVRQLIKEERTILEDKNRLIEDIEAVITEEFMREDELDEETKKILSDHIDEIRRSNIEYNEIFRKVRKKLAEEKGMVL